MWLASGPETGQEAARWGGEVGQSWHPGANPGPRLVAL